MKYSDFNEIDIKKKKNSIREQDLTGRVFLSLTEEELTREPSLAKGIMELRSSMKN